jgi:hypothetical protein
MVRTLSAALVGCLCASFAGCSFESDGGGDGIVQQNSCNSDEQCGAEGVCREGMCIAPDVALPLAITLVVSPLLMPDGTEALPIELESFALDGPTVREWMLPMPVTVDGAVHNGAEPLQAEVRFIPVEQLPNLQARAVAASTLSEGDDGSEGEFSARLLEGVEYAVAIEPIGVELPPFYDFIEAEQALNVAVDYTDLELVSRTFTVEGIPAGRSLSARAFDSQNGQPVTAAHPIVDGEVTLLFGPGAAKFRIDISAEPDETADTSGDGACDHGSADFPTFSIDDADIPAGKAGVKTLTLPTAKQPIRYKGTIDLCEQAASDASAIESLPISLRSVALETEDGELSPFVGSFNANTSAKFDEATSTLSFCIEVIPGDYEVVVTPPVSLECAIFAEERLIKGPAEGDAIGSGLTLPSTAYIGGTLQTIDQDPLSGATIDAQALGRREGIELAETDRSVTRYNRSRQATSDMEGMFRLPLDLGAYDVVVKPPAAGGFPWQILHDVNIGSRDVDFLTIINVDSPVPVEGTLRYRGGDDAATATLEGAEIRAFTLIDDPDLGERAINVGTAVVDADGSFTLLLSGETRNGWY